MNSPGVITELLEFTNLFVQDVNLVTLVELVVIL